MKIPKSSRVAKPVAERRLIVIGEPDRSVIVSIGKPRPDPLGDWACSFRIEGISEGRRHRAHGIDALQALLNAIEGVRTKLDASGLDLKWEGGEPGDAGIPRMVPSFFGREFAQKIEHHIDREIQNFPREVKAWAGRRKKGFQ